MLHPRMRKLCNFGEGSKQVNEYERARHNFSERQHSGGSLRKAVAVSTLGDAAPQDAEAMQFRGRFEAG